MNIALIDPANAGVVWPHVERLLSPAIDQSGGRYTIDATRHAISTGEMQLWVAHEDSQIYAAMTSSVVVYPAKKMLAVIHCGGRMMGLWLPTMSSVEAWAKSHGCEGVEIVGRAGWAKALPGYARSGTLIERYF